MKKDHEKIWDRCLEVIKDNVSQQSFKTWFEPIKALRLQDHVLTIQVPSQFFYEWLEEHYIGLLKKIIKKELGNEGRLEYSIIMENGFQNANPYTVKMPTSHAREVKNPACRFRSMWPTAPSRIPFIIPGLRKIKVESHLNANYSFDTFIEGDCNRLAPQCRICRGAEARWHRLQSVVDLWWCRLGKTHLAHAIGIEIKKNHPDKTILYVPAEKFTQQFIEAVKNNTVGDFTQFYQMMDVLFIDDVQFLAGKEKTQDVFFHVFNALHQSGKQLVITSDKAPVEMAGMEQRLLSRFKWGLSADLQTPGLETRIAILEKKMYAEGIDLPKEVVEYLGLQHHHQHPRTRRCHDQLDRTELVEQEGRDARSREADDRQVREEHGARGEHRLHPESGVRLLRPADRTTEEQDPQTRSGASPSDRDVLRQEDDQELTGEHRCALRRQGPRDRIARLPHGEQPARDGQAVPWLS
jgi:chromosomal replication initiator protein